MAEHKREWHRLDNTANLFPVITSKKIPNVFRISITLTQPIEPELLQKALTTCLPWFDAMRVRLRQGMFWYYLDANKEQPSVFLESTYPVQKIDPQQNHQFLFRVSYFSNRINLDVNHVLTDGTGAAQFLRAICCQYLLLAHPLSFTTEQRQTRWLAAHSTDTEDSYLSNYTPTKKTTFNIGRAFKIKGEWRLLDNPDIFHAYMPVDSLLNLCRKKGVTVTQYLTAQIAYAIYTNQAGGHAPRHPINIFVPVNLRNLFESTTTLNFFSNIYISMPMQGGSWSFEDVLAETKRQFEEKLTPEAMLQRISYTVSSEYNPFIRAVPLPIKSIVLRAIFKQSAKSSTTVFSNIGPIDLPDIFMPYVQGAAFMLSCVPREPFKTAVCTSNGLVTLTFTCKMDDAKLPKAIIRRLANEGVPITVQTNGVSDETL